MTTNDFTPEELDAILSWADVYCEFEKGLAYYAHKPLIDKIQSMLNNHFEHDKRIIDSDNCEHKRAAHE